LSAGIAARVFDHFGDPAHLIGDVDLQLARGRRVVAAVAAVSNDAGEARANLRLELRDDGLERVAVVRISGQRLHVGDELPALPSVWSSQAPSQVVAGCRRVDVGQCTELTKADSLAVEEARQDMDIVRSRRKPCAPIFGVEVIDAEGYACLYGYLYP